MLLADDTCEAREGLGAGRFAGGRWAVLGHGGKGPDAERGVKGYREK